jgi:hypothetical protein
LGEHDLIFERLRFTPDGTGDVAHSHATFRALIAGVEPTTPPPGRTRIDSRRPLRVHSTWTPSATARTAGDGPWAR